MLFNALFFLAGLVVFSTKNTLEFSVVETTLILALFIAFLETFRRKFRISAKILFAIVGFVWMAVFSHTLLNQSLDGQFLNQPIETRGFIVSLPSSSVEKSIFLYEVVEPFQAKVRLSWYGTDRPKLIAGDEWALTIKLKHNNGLRNQGGFDYEKWLFANKINATGYVRKIESNQVLSSSNSALIHQLRQSIRTTLSPYLQELDFSGVINALVLGDRSLIKSEHWLLFQQTNTTHLSVISGLHIGLISTLLFFITTYLWRLSRRLVILVPAQVVGSFFGIIGALSYAFIAGFSVPTQRAFIMASVAFLSIILRTQYSVWTLYGLAMLMVLILNPLSVFDVGFWLSFYAVGVILYGVSLFNNKPALLKLIYLQLLICIAMLPITLWFFQSSSSLSGLANLVAIPTFSLIVTPISLLGALFSFAEATTLAQLCFDIADKALSLLGIFLQQISDLSFNRVHFMPACALDLLILVLGACLLILPRGLKLRRAALILIVIPIFTSQTNIPPKAALIDVLDVGQGLSVIVRTENHTLIYDTGSQSPSGFNMGDAALIPFLITNQVNSIDTIIISHGDNDHIGGLQAIMDNFTIGKILSSVPNKIPGTAERCHAGQFWLWDGVQFEILSPSSHTTLKGNNASCVLKITTKDASLLLTGDIEKKAEKALLQNNAINLDAEVMIIPHHGSKTSSTEAFIAAISPAIAISSSGYRNPYKHPAAVIVERYKNNGVVVFDTNCSGQLSFILDNEIVINEYRKDQRSFYHRQCNED
ncbi:MAG TPA: DNA internalization-related competence protein ComEC/Rec2 [Candidatus Thioglobus sp.]|nr:DNA internalization-related competence protein ComEC/Rec2 [Candidatus Thioglobus sp.]